MRCVVRGRQQGKTLELMRLCASEGGYMVCHSRQEATRVFHLARSMGLDIPMPITHAEFVKGQYYGAGVALLWIDNADILIQGLATVRVAGVALSAEGEL
jgi:hypothetical protein